MPATSTRLGPTPVRCAVPFALLVLASCGAPPLELGEVEGKVILNGKPLGGAIVRFYPISDNREQLPYASGRTDAAGRYRLMRGEDQVGAVVGQNRVVVKWPSRDTVDENAEGPAPGPPPYIPLRYTVASDTPLIFEVKTGKQTIDLPLQDQP
jgi:hypothetical protein